jgi:hypothetical protein
MDSASRSRAPKYVPPDHTGAVPVVKENDFQNYNVSGLNIKGQ